MFNEIFRGPFGRYFQKFTIIFSGTLAVDLNMHSSQGSRLRYTFEKHLFNQKHV